MAFRQKRSSLEKIMPSESDALTPELVCIGALQTYAPLSSWDTISASHTEHCRVLHSAALQTRIVVAVIVVSTVAIVSPH